MLQNAYPYILTDINISFHAHSLCVLLVDIPTCLGVQMSDYRGSPTSGLTGPPRRPTNAAIQDGPPPGGYPPIDVRRNLPKVGPSGTTLLIGVGLITIYGFWGASRNAQRRKRLNQEKYQIRLAVAPFLQAEEDRHIVKAVSHHHLCVQRKYSTFILESTSTSSRTGAYEGCSGVSAR